MITRSPYYGNPSAGEDIPSGRVTPLNPDDPDSPMVNIHPCDPRVHDAAFTAIRARDNSRPRRRAKERSNAFSWLDWSTWSPHAQMCYIQGVALLLYILTLVIILITLLDIVRSRGASANPLDLKLTQHLSYENGRPWDKIFDLNDHTPRYDPNSEDYRAFRPKREATIPLETVETSKGDFTSGLAQTLIDAKRKLGTTVNLALGAVLENAGLALVTDNYAMVSVITGFSVPYWTPIELRSPDWKTNCKAYNESVRARCQRLMDPDWEKLDCPMTSTLYEQTREVLQKFRERYEHAVDPSVPSNVLDQFCRNHPGFCTLETAEPTLERPWARGTRIHDIHVRSKRGLGGLILMGGLTLASAAGSAYSYYNGAQLDAKIRQLNTAMSTMTDSMIAMTEGFNLLNNKTDLIIETMSSGFDGVYESIEQIRCMDLTRLKRIQETTEIHIYRQYLSDQLAMVMQTAMSGKITPEFIGVSKALGLLAKIPSLVNSLMVSNIGLFYQLATAIPVRLDYHQFKFGFILQIPILFSHNIYPLYRVHNAGFITNGPQPLGLIAAMKQPTRTQRSLDHDAQRSLDHNLPRSLDHDAQRSLDQSTRSQRSLDQSTRSQRSLDQDSQFMAKKVKELFRHWEPFDLENPVTVVLKARLPKYVVPDSKLGLIPLDLERCSQTFGIYHCPPETLDQSGYANPCLRMLTDPNCTDCTEHLECMSRAQLSPASPKEVRVITTQSGLMIRTGRVEVKTQKLTPFDIVTRPKGTSHKWTAQTPSVFGTLFLSYKDFDLASVNNVTYTSWGDTYTITNVFQPPYKVAHALGRQARGTDPNDPWIRLHENNAALQALLARLEPPSVLDSHAFKVGMSTTTLLGTLLAVILVVILLYCCKCCPSCITKSSGRCKPWLDYRVILEKLSGGNIIILDEPGARNLFQRFDFAEFRRWFLFHTARLPWPGRGQRPNADPGAVRVSFARSPSVPQLAQGEDFEDEGIHFEPPPRIHRLQRPTTLAVGPLAVSAGSPPAYGTLRRNRSMSRDNERRLIMPSTASQVLVLTVNDNFFVNAVQTRSQARSQDRAYDPPPRYAEAAVESNLRRSPSNSISSIHNTRSDTQIERDVLEAEAAELIHEYELADRNAGWTFGLTAGFRCEPMVALIDTGAQVSLIDESLATGAGATIWELAPHQRIVQQADGANVNLIGFIEGALSMRGATYGHKFYVRPNPPLDMPRPYNAIIGIDLLKKMGQITINFHQKVLYIKDMAQGFMYKYHLDPNDRQIMLRSTAGREVYRTNSERQSIVAQPNEHAGSRPFEHAGSPPNEHPGSPPIPAYGPATSTPIPPVQSPASTILAGRRNRRRLISDASESDDQPLSSPPRLQINEAGPSQQRSPQLHREHCPIPSPTTSSSEQRPGSSESGPSSQGQPRSSPGTIVTGILGNQGWLSRDHNLARQAQAAVSAGQRQEQRQQAFDEIQRRRRQLSDIRHETAANIRAQRGANASVAFEESPNTSNSQPSDASSDIPLASLRRGGQSAPRTPPQATVLNLPSAGPSSDEYVEAYADDPDLSDWIILRKELDDLANRMDVIALNGMGLSPTEAG